MPRVTTPPFVGRSAETERLLDLARGVEAGRAAGALIMAEPGLGKTRLLARCMPRWRGKAVS